MSSVRSAIVLASLLAACPATFAAAQTPSPGRSSSTLTVPAGRLPAIDGRESPAEWDDTGRVAIDVGSGWTVGVRFKCDATNLYVAFDHLASEDRRSVRYPEVVVSPRLNRSEVWAETDWWFHGSFRDCQSRGRFNDYASCTPAAAEWESSNYTTTEHAPELIEMRIPFATLGLSGRSPADIGLAFDVTDTRREWVFWPATADMRKPSTWGRARLECDAK